MVLVVTREALDKVTDKQLVITSELMVVKNHRERKNVSQNKICGVKERVKQEPM